MCVIGSHCRRIRLGIPGSLLECILTSPATHNVYTLPVPFIESPLILLWNSSKGIDYEQNNGEGIQSSYDCSTATQSSLFQSCPNSGPNSRLRDKNCQAAIIASLEAIHLQDCQHPRMHRLPPPLQLLYQKESSKQIVWNGSILAIEAQARSSVDKPCVYVLERLFYRCIERTNIAHTHQSLIKSTR